MNATPELLLLLGVAESPPSRHGVVVPNICIFRRECAPPAPGRAVATSSGARACAVVCMQYVLFVAYMYSHDANVYKPWHSKSNNILYSYVYVIIHYV